MADRESLDLLLGDMAAGQSRAGEVTPKVNHTLAASLLERLDQKRADQDRRLVPTPAPRAPIDTAEPRASDLEAKRRGYRLLRGGDLSSPGAITGGELPTVAAWGKREQWFYAAISARVKLLMRSAESGPLGAASWRTRAMAVLALATTGQRTLAAKQMIELCKESEAAFGPLFFERDPKLFVGGVR